MIIGPVHQIVPVLAVERMFMCLTVVERNLLWDKMMQGELVGAYCKNCGALMTDVIRTHDVCQYGLTCVPHAKVAEKVRKMTTEQLERAVLYSGYSWSAASPVSFMTPASSSASDTSGSRDRSSSTGGK